MSVDRLEGQDSGAETRPINATETTARKPSRGDTATNPQRSTDAVRGLDKRTDTTTPQRSLPVPAQGATRPYSGECREQTVHGGDALKRWTGKSGIRVVFDSVVDPFTDHDLFDRIKGKRNVAVIAFTTDGDVFGGFHHVAVTEHECSFFDPSMFIFSFQSHGRCMTPQRFVLREEMKGNVSVYYYRDCRTGWFVWFGADDVCSLGLGNERGAMWCHRLSNGFKGVQDTTLTGKAWDGDGCMNSHQCCRLVAVQLF